MSVYDAIRGTIYRYMHVYPCESGGYNIMGHYRKQVNTNIDSHVYLIEDGHSNVYRAMFHVVMNDCGEITKYIPIFARGYTK